MKICLACSHGGHLTETLQLLKAFEGYDIFFATYNSLRNDEVKNIARAYFTENIGYNIWRMIKACFWALGILLREKPAVIISLGAEIAIPFFYLGKLMGSKTIFIEGLARVTSASGTGKIVYPVSDIFLVQWEPLLKIYGRKARYEGSVI